MLVIGYCIVFLSRYIFSARIKQVLRTCNWQTLEEDFHLLCSCPEGFLSPKSYVDVPAGPRKSDYLYTNFLPNFPPISIPFSKEKHIIWPNWVLFYNNLPQIHPIYVIWAPSSLMKFPRSLYQISGKSAPKCRYIYVYHVSVRTPPPGSCHEIYMRQKWLVYISFQMLQQKIDFQIKYYNYISPDISLRQFQ